MGEEGGERRGGGFRAGATSCSHSDRVGRQEPRGGAGPIHAADDDEEARVEMIIVSMPTSTAASWAENGGRGEGGMQHQHMAGNLQHKARWPRPPDQTAATKHGHGTSVDGSPSPLRIMHGTHARGRLAGLGQAPVTQQASSTKRGPHAQAKPLRPPRACRPTLLLPARTHVGNVAGGTGLLGRTAWLTQEARGGTHHRKMRPGEGLTRQGPLPDCLRGPARSHCL